MTRIAPPALPLDRDAFERAVRRGLGRAILHVRRHGITGYEDVVTSACCREDAYETYGEDRTDYLDALVAAARLEGPVTTATANALRTATGRDRDQAVCTLTALALRGYTDAAAAVRAAFVDPATRDAVLDSLIELDRDGGLLSVARALGADALRGEDITDRLEGVLWTAKETLGHDRVHDVLGRAADGDPAIGALTTGIRELDASDDASQAPEFAPAAVTLADILETDPGSPDAALVARRLGRSASDEDVDAVLDALPTADNPERLALLLLALRAANRRREHPRFDDRILALTAHASRRVRDLAVWALEGCTDAEARFRALDMLEDDPADALLAQVPRLLVGTYLPGDHVALETALESLDAGPGLDDDALHAAGWGLRVLLEAHPVNDLLDVALWAYENEPCAVCRQAIAEVLVDLSGVPAWVREEIPLHSEALDRSWEG